MNEGFSMNKTENSKDNFETGIFWELYLDLESQYEDFLEYVPYLPGNERTYSFRLLNLTLTIGGHVDSAFKEMARYPKFAGNSEVQEILRTLEDSEKRKDLGKGPIPVTIGLPLKAFDKEYGISRLEVVFKRLPQEETLVPFKPFNQKTGAPEWWDFYNGLKHDVGLRLEEANLRNTLHALAGAFLLNAIHIPSALRLFEYGIFKVPYMTPGEVWSSTSSQRKSSIYA